MKARLLPYLAAGLVCLCLPSLERKAERTPSVPRDTVLTCLVRLEDRRLEQLNRTLLRRYAGEMEVPVKVLRAGKDWNCADSVLAGRYNLLVTDIRDTASYRHLVPSVPTTGGTVWSLPPGNPAGTGSVNRWLTSLAGSGRYRRMSARYLAGEEGALTTISPYDPLIRREAARTGLDWRLIAAVMYKESNFNPDAVSPAGAVGLMQLRPVSASADSLMDPATNIHAGTAYLKQLRDIFRPYAANGTECTKYALAAYNAGDGRILGCIRFAREKGVDTAYWEHLVSVLGDVPGFNGRETVAFVDAVMDTWGEYAQFCLP